MTILDEIASYAKERVETAKETLPLHIVKERAMALPKGDFSFEEALKGQESFFDESEKAKIK